MPENALELHPQALEDALAGYSWYLGHNEVAADRFLAELERAIQLILEGPERWPVHLHGTRRLVLMKFPYSIVYRVSKSVVIIYAFAHAKKRPEYWRGRLGADPPVL